MTEIWRFGDNSDFRGVDIHVHCHYVWACVWTCQMLDWSLVFGWKHLVYELIDEQMEDKSRNKQQNGKVEIVADRRKDGMVRFSLDCSSATFRSWPEDRSNWRGGECSICGLDKLMTIDTNLMDILYILTMLWLILNDDVLTVFYAIWD